MYANLRENRTKLFLLLVVMLCFILSGSVVFNTGAASACPRVKPVIFNMEHLKELRGEDFRTNQNIYRFLKDADALLEVKPVTVMDKEKTFASKPHTYCSLSRYAWPSDNNPELYVIKDGQTNPEWNEYDLPKLDMLSSRLKTLSVAYYITRDRKYYDVFVSHLRTWFLDEDTYMEPNMEFAQVQPGKNDNKGMAYGLVDLNRFTPVIESICLVQSVKKLDIETCHGIEHWFADILAWTLNSNQWASVLKSSNNIVAALFVTLVEMARFTGDIDTMRRLSADYKANVLEKQIDEEGKQPAELRRTIGFGYSVGNLNNIIDFCLIMEQSGIHFYRDNQQKIDSAFEYLLQFVGNHEAFPYQQIQGWDGYEKKLMRNISRLSRLKSNKGRRFGNTSQSKFEVNDVLNYVY